MLQLLKIVEFCSMQQNYPYMTYIDAWIVSDFLNHWDNYIGVSRQNVSSDLS